MVVRWEGAQAGSGGAAHRVFIRARRVDRWRRRRLDKENFPESGTLVCRRSAQCRSTPKFEGGGICGLQIMQELLCLKAHIKFIFLKYHVSFGNVRIHLAKAAIGAGARFTAECGRDHDDCALKLIKFGTRSDHYNGSERSRPASARFPRQARKASTGLIGRPAGPSFREAPIAPSMVLYTSSPSAPMSRICPVLKRPFAPVIA